MKWFLSLIALMTFSNASLANQVEFKEDRSLICLDYDDENIYLSGKLIYLEESSKYRVSADVVGYNSREAKESMDSSTITFTNPASGVLVFETTGDLGTIYELTKGDRANSFKGTATINKTKATYTVNCTYSGPEFPSQGE